MSCLFSEAETFGVKSAQSSKVRNYSKIYIPDINMFLRDAVFFWFKNECPHFESVSWACSQLRCSENSQSGSLVKGVFVTCCDKIIALLPMKEMLMFWWDVAFFLTCTYKEKLFYGKDMKDNVKKTRSLFLLKQKDRFCIVLIQKVINGIQIKHIVCVCYFCTYYWLFALTFVNTTLFASVFPPSCWDLCVCVLHLYLFLGLEAQMYIRLILVPAVEPQQGLKDSLHSLLRKSLQETHTHTHPYIHNGWSKTLQETAQGNSCQARADYFPPYFLFLYFPSFPSPLLITPRFCVCILSSSSWGHCTDVWSF